MTNKNDVQNDWQQEQASYFDSAVGYYALELLDEAETELNKIDPAISINSVSVLALQLGIAYGRKDWNKMKTLARQLFLLEPGNPKWPYSHGFATAKLIQTENQIKLKQKAFDG